MLQCCKKLKVHLILLIINMLKIILVCVVGLTCVYAPEPPPRCVAPAYFQAQVNMHDHETNFFRAGFFSYDALGEKVHFLEYLQENATRPQATELFLYREKKHYRIDLKTGICNVSALDLEFRPIAVREDSRLLGDDVIGTLDEPGEGVLISVWGHHVDDSRAQGNMTVSFTRDDCIPFTESFYGMSKTSKQELHYHRTFFDVTLGLSDPNIFDVPKACMK